MLTVVAAPGVEDCVAVTEPLCAVLPDSGNCVACVPWDCPGGVWANALPLGMQMKMPSRIDVALVFRRLGSVFSFVFVFLFPIDN